MLIPDAADRVSCVSAAIQGAATRIRRCENHATTLDTGLVAGTGWEPGLIYNQLDRREVVAVPVGIWRRGPPHMWVQIVAVAVELLEAVFVDLWSGLARLPAAKRSVTRLRSWTVYRDTIGHSPSRCPHTMNCGPRRDRSEATLLGCDAGLLVELPGLFGEEKDHVASRGPHVMNHPDDQVAAVLHHPVRIEELIGR